MSRLKTENESFLINYPASLESFASSTFVELNKSKVRILSFFKLNDFRQVEVILFDNKELFRSFVLELRGANSTIPEYAIGVFDNGKIITCIDLNSIKDPSKFNSQVFNNVHEFVHIVYAEKIYKKRVIWLDEGLAVNLDGRKDYLNDVENFKKFLEKNIFSITIMPKLNELSHGSGFVNSNYNAYDIVYLCVRYLMETLTSEEFMLVLSDYETAISVGENVLTNALSYYKNKFFENETIKKVY